MIGESIHQLELHLHINRNIGLEVHCGFKSTVMEEGLCLAQYESFDLNTDEARRRNEWMNEYLLLIQMVSNSSDLPTNKQPVSTVKPYTVAVVQPSMHY
jgi:hypothetical protein